jgi:hypothetical protein
MHEPVKMAVAAYYKLFNFIFNDMLFYNSFKLWKDFTSRFPVSDKEASMHIIIPPSAY